MKPNCSTANRTSVRVKSSPRSPRSAAASRGSETLCRPSLPTAEASPAACAAPAKWCADSTQCTPTAGDATRASAASTNASTGAAVQTPTPAAADAAPAVRSTSDNEPSATSARASANPCATREKPAAADVAPAARTTSGNGSSAAPARPFATADAAAKKPSAATGALSAEQRAAAVAAGVVLRSADDRTALFTQWLAPHLPMVRGLVRRHTYFAGERADDYQTAVLHLLEHLDDLAHFALCLTVRRDTANDPALADEPSAQPTTQVARDFDEKRVAVDETAFFPDEHAPYLYASAAESNESQREVDETQREVDETPPTAEEALREVNETQPDDDEALRAIDTAAVGFDAMTDADDEALREVNETRREVDETQPADDETAAADEAIAAAALEGSERTRVPLPVTAEEVLHTVGPFNPRPWLAGVTLRLLSTLNHRALRHRETHLTPASADSDELFDPADPDGGLWAVGAAPATAVAQEHAAPSR